MRLAYSIGQRKRPFSMSLLAGTTVVVFGLLLIGLAVAIFVAPAFAKRFLLSFASSARTHYTEQVIRLLVGASLVVFSPAMWQADIFHVIGWAIFISSLVLVLLPWEWHHRFGERVRPMLVRHINYMR